MLVPKTIQVGGHVYTIRFNAVKVRDEGRRGLVNHRLQLIELGSERSESGMYTTLIHELVHIIDYVYNHNDLSEGAIDSLAEGLNQVLPQLGLELDWSEIPHV